MKTITTLLLFALVSTTFFSCIRENVSGNGQIEHGQPATVDIQMPDLHSISGLYEGDDHAEHDATYYNSNAYVLVFNSFTGKLAHHYYLESIMSDSGNAPVMKTLEMTTGVWDFVFVVNAVSGSGLQLKSRIETLIAKGNEARFSDLDDIMVADGKNIAQSIPAVGVYKGVKVISTGTLEYPMSIYEPGYVASGDALQTRRIENSHWPVFVERIHSQLLLTIKTKSDAIKNALINVSVSNGPQSSPLMEYRSDGRRNHNHNTAFTPSELAASKTDFAIDDPNYWKKEGDTWVCEIGEVVGWIIPENMFDPASQADRAYRLSVEFHPASGMDSRYVTFGMMSDNDAQGAQLGDYTVPRNYVFKFTGIIPEQSNDIVFDGEVIPWSNYSQAETDITPDMPMQPVANCYLVEPDSDPIAIPLNKPGYSYPYVFGYLTDLMVQKKLKIDVLWSQNGAGAISRGIDGVTRNAPVRAVRLVEVRTNGDIDPEKSHVLLTPGAVEGNAMVVAYIDGNEDGEYDYFEYIGQELQDQIDHIVFSWHIWVSGDAKAITAGNWMDRNLGALTNDWGTYPPAGDDSYDPVRGMFYQWGRQTPFYDRLGDRIIGYFSEAVGGMAGIELFYLTTIFEEWCGAYGYDVYNPSQPNDSWDTNVEDLYEYLNPCPAGWQVPMYESFDTTFPVVPSGTWRHGHVTAWGGFWPEAAYHIGTSVNGSTAGSLSVSPGNIEYVEQSDLDVLRHVRCVRENPIFEARKMQHPEETWDEMRYVGAFWRNGQVGERVITGVHTGVWSATVEGAGQSWVKISKTASDDARLFGQEPGDAEKYPVIDGQASVNGTGNIYFRIGLTSRQSVGAMPRYARIKVDYIGPGSEPKTSYIYVRQGETPDDVLNSGALWSPYNLTDLAGRGRGSGVGVDLGYRGGRFTEYPSQTGYFFRWNSTTAVWPDGGYEDFLSPPYYDDYDVDYWQPGREVCPAGYITPNLDEIFFFHDDQDPGSDITNYTVSGFYADGFFDRRKIKITEVEEPELMIPLDAYPMVGSGSKRAKHGLLLFDRSGRSLFFPFGGLRVFAEGLGATIEENLFYLKLYENTGFYGMSVDSRSTYDHNSIAIVPDHGFMFDDLDTTVAPMTVPKGYKGGATSIRCVKQQ